MLSSANREIRTMERQAAERHQRFTGRDVLRWMDRLVAELEENNLAGERRVPESFLLELDELAQVLPAGVTLPAIRPPTTNDMLDYLFGLEQQLLDERRRVRH